MDDFIRSIGASFEKGRLSVHPGVEDEPLPADAVADYRVALEIALRRRDNERNRLDRIEGKIAPIIAGTIAAFALFLDKANGWLDIAAGALYLIPLWQLFVAFRTYEYIDVPNLDNLKETWQRWPQTFLKAAFEGTVDAVNRNAPTIDDKARQLNGAMKYVFWITVIVLGLRIVEVSPIGGYFSVNFRPRPTPTTTAATTNLSTKPTTGPNPAVVQVVIRKADDQRNSFSFADIH